MLEQVLRHLNNWFLVEIHEGTFTVENGSIALPFLLTNQYFRICGSVFNDGLHQYPAADLTDETFTGTGTVTPRRAAEMPTRALGRAGRALLNAG